MISRGMISKEEAIKQLTKLSLTTEEAEEFLVANEQRQREIAKVVQSRLKMKHVWMPMTITEGPPLPRKFGIYWPWTPEV